MFFQKYTEKNTLPLGKTVILADGFLWGILLEDEGLTFIFVVKNAPDHSVVDKALDDIKSRFIRGHGADWRRAGPYGLQTMFEPQLILVKQSMLSFSDSRTSFRDPSDDISTGYLHDNIEDRLILHPMEDFDPTMRDGSLSVSADPIHYNIRHGFQDVLSWGVVIFVAILLIYFILAVACGGFALKPGCR